MVQKDSSLSAKIVYLDQKVWINLAKIHYGDPSKSEKELLEKIVKATDNGTAIFPLSMIHFSETCRISKERWRKQLATLMAKISHGYTITPYWTYVLEIEIQNLVLETLGLPKRNIRNCWLGKGIPHAMGLTPTIVSENETLDPVLLEDLNWQMMDALNNPQTFEILLREFF